MHMLARDRAFFFSSSSLSTIDDLHSCCLRGCVGVGVSLGGDYLGIKGGLVIVFYIRNSCMGFPFFLATQYTNFSQQLFVHCSSLHCWYVVFGASVFVKTIFQSQSTRDRI
ncbi:hypothetical protein BU24DRAFT_199251 [Aaosphaeria arxii CBS 175.79]|uniref:Uncharacterized protein n=1 Tax=Aaosphaeria arxii CBS 175.79 TaxID=1450172 RepID=A0A6A5XTU1_9PLEO|nr:uncharacterized protein BU24DRAFT_199251 [Aaosphaeria arxii CBS 175.79]KAF2016329.1 hypothetical protein BU24DRAFT_199251 [Aaosphaeria arxii CBS 175.79]